MSSFCCNSSGAKRWMRVFCVCHLVVSCLAIIDPPLQQTNAHYTHKYEYHNVETMLHRFNGRFRPLQDCQLHSCRCLWELTHLNRMLGIDVPTNEASNTTKYVYSENEVLQLSTLMLTNVINDAQSECWLYDDSDSGGSGSGSSSFRKPNATTDYESKLTQLMPTVARQPNFHLHHLHTDLEALLKALDPKMIDDDLHSSFKQDCINSESLIEEVKAKLGQQIEASVEYSFIVMLIVEDLAAGKCIELFDSKYLHDIIVQYGTKNESISFDGLKRLLKDLRIGGYFEKFAHLKDDHLDDNHESNDPHQPNEPHHHHHESEDSSHQDESHESREHRSIEANEPNENHIEPKHDDAYRVSTSVLPPIQCIELDSYWKSLELDSGSLLDRDGLRLLSPVFIQQILSRACTADKLSKQVMTAQLHQTSSRAKVTTWKLYLYSSVAVFVISLTALAGILLLPFLRSHIYDHVINMLIGVAFGCLAGDALFHLIPQVFGLHSHGDHDHDHHHRHGDHEHSMEYLYYMIATLVTIYLLFLFELISSFWSKYLSHGHNHVNVQTTHSHHHDTVHHHHHHLDLPSDQTPYSSSLTLDTSVSTRINNNNNSGDAKSISTTALNGSAPVVKKAAKNDTIIFGMNSLAMIITIGDSIHNCIDGIAIGIAFSNSVASGISTTIAVFCHELPHEFGDFAVLLSTGMTVRRAAVINFISALTAFIGLYFGIWLGENELANKWALAVCAGLFLYVALCDMIPELKEIPAGTTTNQWIISTLFKNAGVLLGFACMITLSLFEDKLNFDF